MEGQENRTTMTKIYNLIILDESGSMMSIYNQALSGANETIQTIRSAQASSDDQQQFLTFVTFDSGNRTPVRTIIDTLPIDQVKDLTEDDYRPNGCTPLYDAMGKSLTALEHNVKDGDQVLVIRADLVEMPSSRYIKFYYKGQPCLKQYETPGGEYLSELIIKGKNELSQNPALGITIGKIDDEYLKYKFDRVFAPDIKMKLVK